MILIDDGHKRIEITCNSQSVYCDSSVITEFITACKALTLLPLDFIKVTFNVQTNKYELHIKTKDTTPRNFKQDWRLLNNEVFIVFGNITGEWKYSEYGPVTKLRDTAVALILNHQATILEFRIL